MAWCQAAGLPRLWLLGWSFGTELVLRWGNDPAVEGRSCCRRRCTGRATRTSTPGPPRASRLVVLVPGLDDYLRPPEARDRFARVPQAELIAVERAKHLWVGEPCRPYRAGEIVRRVNPAAWPLPTEWEDPAVTPFDLTGKKAFVTGASRGIGQAIARRARAGGSGRGGRGPERGRTGRHRQADRRLRARGSRHPGRRHPAGGRRGGRRSRDRPARARRTSW